MVLLNYQYSGIRDEAPKQGAPQQFGATLRYCEGDVLCLLLSPPQTKNCGCANVNQRRHSGGVEPLNNEMMPASDPKQKHIVVINIDVTYIYK